jgi:ABC-type glycerol-3-phosphate transport system substrate-binding protein
MRTKFTGTRRDMLRVTAAGVGLGLAGQVAGLGRASAQAAYQGDVVVVAQAPSTPDKALPVLLEQFQAAHPGANVKLVSYPGDKFPALFSAAQLAGEQIDLILMQGLEIRRYIANNTIMPLEGMVSYQDRFRAPALGPGRLAGHIYGLPIGSLGSYPVLVNKALLDKAKVGIPSTYEELVEVGKALKAIGANAFTAPAKNIVLLSVYFSAVFPQVTGNKGIERLQDILIGKAKWTDPEVVETLEWIARLGSDGLMPSTVLGLDNVGAINEFSTGKAAFFMFIDAAARPILADKPEGVNLDWMALPKLRADAGYPQVLGGPRSLLCLPANLADERKEITLALLDHLTANESCAKVLEINGGYIPANANAPLAPSDAVFVQKVRANADKIVLYHDWIIPPEINRVIFNEGIQALFVGRADPKELAANAQAIFDRLVKEGYSFIPYT